MFLRLSVPPGEAEVEQELTARRESVVPEPTYGAQLQDLAIPGHQAEGKMVIDYEELPVTLEGGEVVHLRKPTYGVADLAYGPMHPDVMLSPRVAQPMIGLGLLEAIPEDQILAHADPDDLDGDGISGRPNQVWSEERDAPMLGRFGWKAGQPTLAQQSSSALAADIGVSNPLAPVAWGECSEAEIACREAPDGNSPQYENLEAPDEVMEKILFYVRHLAVPARRALYDEQTLRGKELFYGAGCSACHMPKFVTARDAAEPALQYQLIWPYADMLLHDMGEGLADHRPEGSGRRPRMAHAAALGHRPHRSRQRPHPFPARRPGAQPDRGDPLARRRGAGRARPLRRDEQGGARGADRLREFAMRSTLLLALLVLLAPGPGDRAKLRRAQRRAGERGRGAGVRALCGCDRAPAGQPRGAVREP